MKIHIVQKGDTLWKIAKKYGVNFEELKKMNSQLSNPDMIMPGMKVKVPTTGGTVKKDMGMHHHHNPGVKKEQPIAKEAPIKEMPIKEKPIKEMPIKEMPIKEMPIKEVPIKEAPIKEVPIAKEVPKTPYTPKMPLQVAPEIDINNYYTVNMKQMTVQPPPKANVLPEIKEVPAKEMPVVEAPVQVQAPPPCPPADYCVPVTPVMPGPGFCPPFEPFMPFSPMHTAYPMNPGYVQPATGYMPVAPIGGPVPQPAYIPPHLGDESSSSFMPQMPMMNPGYNPGALGFEQPVFGNPGVQYPAGGYQMTEAMPEFTEGFAAGGVPSGYPSATAGYPGTAAGYPGTAAGYPGTAAGYPGTAAGYPGTAAGYPGTAAGYPGTPAGYPGTPAGYPGTPAGYQGTPAGFPAGAPAAPAGYPGGYPMEFQAGYPGGRPMEYPGGYPSAEYPAGAQAEYPYGSETGYPSQYGTPYGQIPYGYPQVSAVTEPAAGIPFGASQPFAEPGFRGQDMPVGTGTADCGCEQVPVSQAEAEQRQQAPFIPPTPPIYSAPYTSSVNVAQPPFMNPYGMGTSGAYGLPRYDEESND